MLTGRPAVILLAAVTFVTFLNAWHGALVLDDRVFVERILAAEPGWGDMARFFTEDLWAASGAESDLYRPLLLLALAAQAWLFGDWVPGYHLAGILLHVLATVAVYGFTRRVLAAVADDPARSEPIALLAAAVFGVHPIHAEVVNSVFNMSETLVCIGVASGLSWLLATYERHPVRAWAGLCAVYLLVLLCRESAAALPALAVATVWLTRSDPWPRRLLLCLPAAFLAIPLVAYLALRANALEPPPAALPPGVATQQDAPSPRGEADAVPPAGDAAPALVREIEVGDLWIGFQPRRLESAVVLWFESLKNLAWPYPLQIYYDPPRTPAWLAAAVQSALLGVALVLCLRGQPLLLIGLAFFYLALLPSSRVFGDASAAPALADRLLYLPSVGLPLMLAAGLLPLARRLGLRAAAMCVTVIVLVLATLSWARNADWTSETGLYERDYARLDNPEIILNTLLGAHLRDGNVRRAVEICDAQRAAHERRASWGVHCGSAYGRVGRFDDAERTYLAATRAWDSKVYAHFNLGMLYLHLDRRDDARRQFDKAISAEPAAFLKSYFSAMALMQLHPDDRALLLEARSHLMRALELQPQHAESREELRALDRRLGLADR